MSLILFSEILPSRFWMVGLRAPRAKINEIFVSPGSVAISRYEAGLCSSSVAGKGHILRSLWGLFRLANMRKALTASGTI